MAVEESNQLKFPFDTTFVKDVFIEYLVFRKAPGDTSTILFNILNIHRHGRKTFNIQATPVERYPDPTLLQGLGAIRYLLKLRKVEKRQFEIRKFEELYMEI